MKKQASQPGVLFELWYADGVRFDLLPSVRSAWRRRGERLALPTPGKNVRVGVVGAVRYPTGDFRFAHQPKSVCTTALFLAVLQTLVKRAKRTGRRIVLVLDNGVCFTGRASTAAIEAAVPYVRIFWLPRYTLETLNWSEALTRSEAGGAGLDVIVKKGGSPFTHCWPAPLRRLPILLEAPGLPASPGTRGPGRSTRGQ